MNETDRSSDYVMPMKVSVVLATYNGGKYLREQLESIFEQSDIPDELIVSDDGSKDETISILREFENKSPCMMKIYLRDAPLGFALNFSDSCLRAVGDVIVFCDQDDVWETDKVREIKSYFLSNPGMELVLHNFAVCDSNLRILVSNYQSYLESENHDPEYLAKGCVTAIRRSLRDRAFPLPTGGGRWTHDQRVHALAYFSATRGSVGKVLMRYRAHASNTSGYAIPKNNRKGSVAAFLRAASQHRSSLASRTLQFFSFRDIRDFDLDEFYLAHSKKPADVSKAQILHSVCSLSELKEANCVIIDRLKVLRFDSRLRRLLGCFRLLMKGTYSDNGGWHGFAYDLFMAMGSGQRDPVVK